MQTTPNMLRRGNMNAVAGISAIALIVSVLHFVGSVQLSTILGDTLMTTCGTQPQAAEIVPSGVNQTVVFNLSEDEERRRKSWALSQRDGNHLDVGVLIFGQEDKLLRFAQSYGEAIQSFRGQVNPFHGEPVDFRLLVTRYPSDNSTDEFREKLAATAALPVENIIFAISAKREFHRAQARNLLHQIARQEKQAVLAMVDVDMWIGPRFLFNALKKVGPGQVYFPVVYSDFRPSSVLLVEKFIGPQSRYSEHRGLWRDFGYGMYALTTENAASFMMKEAFKGWGGEDVEFFRRANATFTVVRGREYDLIHVWHPKYCDNSFVQSNHIVECIRSRDSMEGSSFGRHLLKTLFRDRRTFDLLVRNSNFGLNLKEIVSIARREYETGKAPEDEPLGYAESIIKSKSTGPGGKHV